ncbi:AMP-binding protein [Pseudomonas marginalis]|uniref:AMP-binding protein n=1 Tax=Pseudomonas marginalis TaxID=298 RepID=UPI002A366C78|nr:AMP-binding protein [Pseudomonas marginalis]WPN25855.1 AMP-binding protein [Pseudomonas marginalis]
MTMSSLALEVARAHSSGRTFEHLNDLLLNALRTYHDRTLLHSCDGRSFSGREIEGEIARYVAALKRQGVSFGRTVGLLSGNCIEVLFAQHAISIIGAIFTPFHPMGAPADFAYILDDAAIDLVIVDKEREADIVKAIDLSGRSPRLLTLGGGRDNDLFLLASTEVDDQIELLPIDPEAIVRIIYTGGTTGVPKATLASYRAMSTMFGIQIADWQWPDTIRQLLVAPLSHVGAICFTPTIVGGGTLYVEKGFDPSRVLSVIQQHKITCILMVPTMISALMDHPGLRDFDISSLETIFYGASPITPTRLRAAIEHFGPIFFQFYGQAEAMTTVMTMRREEHDLSSDLRLASCGRPVSEAEVCLVDADGNSVPDGEPGELCVRGPLLMSGYLGKPAETADALRGGWLHTGDVAVRDNDGFLRLVDRAKDMVITGGFNVYPRAVEDVLEAHPGVATACVFGVPNDHWGEVVVAAVVLRVDGTSASELMAYVRERKGSVQTPKRVEIVDHIPLTAVGKPDKKKLRRMFSA